MGTYTGYKYRSGAAALRALTEGSVYFATPGELNDVAEAKFDMTGAAKMADVMKETLAHLARTRGYPNGYSCNLTSSPGVRDDFHEAMERGNEQLRDACQQMGICSTAARPDSQAMWAYYCDGHKGVCFHLEWPDDIVEEYELWAQPVIYTDESRIHNRAHDWRDLMLQLGKENPKWSMDQLLAFMMTDQFRMRWGVMTQARAMSTKHLEWKHEREMRILKPKAGAIPVLARVLRSVIFGRTDFPEWGPIMTTLFQRYRHVDVARMTFSHKKPFVRSQKYTYKLVPLGAA